MELIQTVTVGSGGAASISFSSIPATYDDLQVVMSMRSSAGGSVDFMKMEFNNDTTSGNYSARTLYGSGASASSFVISPGNFTADFNASGSTANTFSSFSCYIPNYRSNTAKSRSVDHVSENNATTAYQMLVAGLWSGTAAITSIQFGLGGANFVEGSSASLYGIRKFNTSAQPKATGGAISFDAVNNKWVHVFTASGTFTPNTNLTNVEYLVVAGGGGGGVSAGGSGGGGAGGYRSSVVGESSGGGASAESTLSLTSGVAQTVTVGAGAARLTGISQRGSNGSNSVFGSITALGGGGGGAYENISNAAGLSGGSGGGSAGKNGLIAGGAGTSGQGFAGGSGNTDEATFRSMGGGGGAGAVGVNGPNSNTGGNGGAGVSSSITGSSVTRGGGGGAGATSGGVGGSGGGGAGGNTTSGTSVDGAGNTGGGGGGNSRVDGSSAGGAGGSGIVIVRYSA
jgi:hypothetical protein